MVVTEGFSAIDLSGGEMQPSDHITGELSRQRGGAGSALSVATVAVWLELSRNMICSVQCKRQVK